MGITFYLLNAALTKINGLICNLNVLQGIETPYLVRKVVKTFTTKSMRKILQRHKLFNGVHAEDDLIKVWSDRFMSAIHKHRAKPDRDMADLRIHTPSRMAYILEDITI